MKKKYNKLFIAGILVEAAKGEKTNKEIAVEFHVFPKEVKEWKEKFLGNLPEIFSAQNIQQRESLYNI